MIAVFGVRQPCCRECSSGRRVSAGWRVPATLPPPPLLTAERISHRPREQRVRQKCPGSEMIAVFGVRQPCCRECSSGNAVSAGWRVPATLPPPLLTAERISHRPREQRVRQKCPGSEMIAVFGARQPCCRECSSGNAVSASMACGSHAAASARPAMRSAQDGVYRPPCRPPPPHRRTHLTPATRTTCTPKMPWQRNDCRFWSAAAMLPRVLVRQCGQRRMACTGHPAAPPLLTAERISHRPREQRVRQKCPGSEMIAVFGVRQPCCRECSSGNAVSASMACGSHAAASARPAMRSAQDGVYRPPCRPPPHRRTHLTPATRTTCTPKMPWQRNDCRFWSAAAMLPRVLVRQAGQRRMACTGHPAAPPSSPPNASHTGHANNVYAKNALAAK
ncbi:MAG: hypothetical protein KatS3mg056_0078 [Chloroflexus sp.]|nr:MAG: hypothetical protein KatS3mg056_0078 [Chloroflexus sp.]